MTSVAAISLLSILSAVPVRVVFDMSFMLLATIGASVVVPMMGAMFLGVWCRMMNVPTPRYRRRWLAYGAGYLAALVMTTLMMLLVKDSSKVPGWFLASLFGQVLAMHAVVVPLVLKTPWGRETAAQALALVLYGAVLVIAMAPVIVHVRGAVDRAEWKADLEQLYRTVTAEKGMAVGQLPETLASVEQAGGTIILLPVHRRGDVVYLGDYVQQNYPFVLEGLFASSMAKIRTRQPESSPLIWQNPATTGSYRLHVCYYDGTVAHLTRREFDYRLECTVVELGRTEPEDPTTRPDGD